MWLTPHLSQTLVSSFSKAEVMQKLLSKTQLVESDIITEHAVFNGYFKENTFSLSLIYSVSQNAIPLATGTVEDTSLGSIIFLRIKLFPAARLYLTVFSFLALLIASVFIFIADFPLAGTASLLAGLANYLILTVNFHRKAKDMLNALKRILAKQ